MSVLRKKLKGNIFLAFFFTKLQCVMSFEVLYNEGIRSKVIMYCIITYVNCYFYLSLSDSFEIYKNSKIFDLLS